VYAFDVSTGDTLWTYDVSADGAEQFHGHPVIDDSTIVVGTDMGTQNRGTLYALNRDDGTLRWKTEADPGLPTDLIAHAGHIYAMTLHDDFLQIDAGDGTVGWATSTTYEYAGDEDESEMPRTDSNPVLYGDMIIVRRLGNRLKAVTAETGESRWTHPVDATITTQLCLAGERVIFGTETLDMIVLSAESGRADKTYLVDRIPTGTMSFYDPLLVYLAGQNVNRPRHVIALDLTTGDVVWERELEDPDPEAYWYVPRIHRWGTNVILGSNRGLLIAYDVELGEPVWRHQLEGAIRGIGHTDDVLLVGTFEGMLYALRFPQ
jgi:outer membrane protein assembly factor BamB